MAGQLDRREALGLAVTGLLVGVAAAVHFADVTPTLAFGAAAVALAALAYLVGVSTEQLGARLGSASAGVIQSALGNLPELFVALFALHEGLKRVVQAALIGSVLANSVLVLGLAFLVGGLRHGTQQFHSGRARITATLALLAAATLAIPTLAHQLNAPAAHHERALSLICAGVLLGLYLLTLPSFLTGKEERTEHGDHAARWSLALTVGVLAAAAAGAVFVSDWFVSALKPATDAIGMSEAFAGLVVVAIAGNAVENVVGVQLAARNQPEFAIAVIMQSSLQVAFALTPVLVFLSLFFATTLTLVFVPLLAVALVLAALLGALVVYDGESTWPEGAILIGLYVVVAASFWWG